MAGASTRVDRKAAIAGYLQSQGGEIRDSAGRTAAIIGEALGLSAHEVGQELKGLENLGRITRDWHPGRRKVFGVRLVSSGSSNGNRAPRVPRRPASAPAEPEPPAPEEGPRPNRSREKVLDYLRDHGPVDDFDGKATAKLKEAIGYEGQATGLRQLLANLEYTGFIEREIRAKQTYRIALKGDERVTVPSRPEPAPPPPAAEPIDLTETGTGEVDYGGMAGHLLRRAAEALAATEDTSEARRQLDAALSRNAELERLAARARAEREAVTAERDELRHQLETACRNTELLTEKLESRSKSHRAMEGLGSDEKALLNRMGGSWRNGKSST